MTNETVTHVTINGKYRLVLERAAVKDRDGYKLEVNGDELDSVVREAERLQIEAKRISA